MGNKTKKTDTYRFVAVNYPVTLSDSCSSQVKTTKTNLMRNLFLIVTVMFSLSTSAKNSEISKVLTQVFNDSTISKYLSKYVDIDSLGYVIFENQGDYYIYTGNIMTKQSALAQPYIGVIKKMKISSNKAKVRIYISSNHINIKAKLSRDNNCQPWFVNSRLVSNLFQIRRNQERLFHYSNS